MKTSAFLVGASALMASASPIKRSLETEWVTDYVTVVVTAGQEQEAQATDVAVENVEVTTTVVATTTQKSYQKPKVEKAKASYTTVWVTASSSSTSTTAPAVEYSTVWIEQVQDTTTSTTSTSTKATSTKATSTSTTKKATVTAASSDDSSSSSSSSSKPALTGEYSDVMVNYHNIHRANHSVSDVTWDSDLASAANELAVLCVFEHNTDYGAGGYGQNIAAWASSEIGEGDANKYGAVSVTDQWYNDEMDNWSYYGQENPPSGLDLDSYGHFTQLVWKGSTTIGCATAYCPSGKMYDGMNAYFTVCNYMNPGNYGGEYGDNVLEPLGKKMVTV